MDIEDLRKLIREETGPLIAATRTHIDSTEDSGAHIGPVREPATRVSQPVPAPHTVLPFQKYCNTPGCHNENPNYKPAKLRCSRCKGPLAVTPEEAPEECIWGCGNSGEGSLEEIEE